MKTQLVFFLRGAVMIATTAFICSCGKSPYTPVEPEETDTTKTVTFPFTEVHSRPGSPYHLKITVEDERTNLAYRDSMVNLFFRVYPKLVAYINPDAGDTVTVFIETFVDRTSLAYANNGELHISTDFFNENLAHIDVLTHESTHFVQDYKTSPMFIQEGLPDFVRHKLKTYSAETGWVLPPYSPSDKLSNYYSQASRFLVWLDNRVAPGVVLDADKACRAGTYNSLFWWDRFGMSAEQLWDVYTADPDTTGAMISIADHIPAADGDLPSGVYTMINRNSGLSADVGGKSPDNLKAISQWDVNGQLNQQWQFVHVTDNWYRIFTGFSSKVIEVSKNGEAGVRQYEWVGSDNQLWRPVLNDDGSWSILNKHSGLALSVEGAGTARGANLVQEVVTSSEAQRWTLTQF